MALGERVATLKAKHAALEDAIRTEIHRPNPDSGTVHDLKRQKLKLKEEIVRLSS